MSYKYPIEGFATFTHLSVRCGNFPAEREDLSNQLLHLSVSIPYAFIRLQMDNSSASVSAHSFAQKQQSEFNKTLISFGGAVQNPTCRNLS